MERGGWSPRRLPSRKPFNNECMYEYRMNIETGAGERLQVDTLIHGSSESSWLGTWLTQRRIVGTRPPRANDNNAAGPA